jgi:RNA polymerase sigma factor (sigma-70 family)
MPDDRRPRDLAASADDEVTATGSYGVDPVGDAERAYLTLLFNKYRGALYRYLSTLVPSTEDASDLLQESYFRLLRRGSLIRVDGLARAYLFETARNLAFDHMRRSASHHAGAHIPIDDCVLESGDSTPDRAVALHQFLGLLAEAILELPEPARTVFLLSRYRSMGYVEIGRFLGISTRTVERRMAEALERLGRRVGAGP